MNVRQILSFWVLGWLFFAPLLAQPTLETARLGDCLLESGERIRDCQVSYRSFGQLNAERSNAILVPSWFGGTSEELAGLIGPGRPFDSSLYFVIAVDALGNGISSSPSNSTAQPGDSFPLFTIRDMVRSQHRLLTEALKIQHLKAVGGLSMGGMQTFEWIVSFPDFMDRAVPIIGSPRLASPDLLLWNAQLSAIENAQQCGCDLQQAMKAVSAIHNFALTTPQHRAAETSRQAFAEFFKNLGSGRETFGPLDWASQLRAMLAQDVSAPFEGSLQEAARAVQARVLVVVGSQDHMVNPGPALEFAKLLGARTLVLENDCGHLAPGCEEERFAKAVSEFLK